MVLWFCFGVFGVYALLVVWIRVRILDLIWLDCLCAACFCWCVWVLPVAGVDGVGLGLILVRTLLIVLFRCILIVVLRLFKLLLIIVGCDYCYC